MDDLKKWKEEDLIKVGVLNFNIWVTPEGNLLSELQVKQCVEDNLEVHLHMTATTAAIQAYLNSEEFGYVVHHYKEKFRKVLEVAEIKPTRVIPDVVKYQKELPFKKR